MKLKVLMMVLAAVLLTGCAGENAESGGTGLKQNTVTQDATMQDTATQGTGETDNTNTTDSTDTEPYVLTFEASTVEGEVLTSDCFADSKLTMINVWATYCNPCLSEMPDLGAIASSYDKADFQMLGIVSDVMSDADEETIAYAQELITETEADYPHLLLNESLYVNLVGAVDSVPTTFFLNQEGELLGYVIGAQSKETWEGLINDLWAEME